MAQLLSSLDLMTPAFALLVLGGAALYFMSPQERQRLLHMAVETGRRAFAGLQRTPFEEEFSAQLRARTPLVIVTPFLVAANVVVFIALLREPGAISDPQTLLQWGASSVTRTANGEWWRLGTAAFVHAGVVRLAVSIAALVSVGVFLERLVGRMAVAAVYLACGVVASVVSLWTAPLTGVTFGASGALFGLYGLLTATLVYGCLRAPRLLVPLVVVKRIGVVGGIFALCSLVTDDLGTPCELAGLATGLVAGLLVSVSVVKEAAPVARGPLVGGVVVAIAVLLAVPLRGMTDARPELARIRAVEEKTSADYAALVERFKLGHVQARALASTIDRTIIPAIEGDRARIEALRGAPPDQGPLLADARRYFTLRLQSWRTRSDGLRTGKLPLLNQAEQSERQALDALAHLEDALPAK